MKIEKSNSQDFNQNEEPRLIRDYHSSLILYEIRKKLNQLTEKMNKNQKINDEHYQQLLQRKQH
jgi:hypothetical protein